MTRAKDLLSRGSPPFLACFSGAVRMVPAPLSSRVWRLWPSCPHRRPLAATLRSCPSTCPWPVPTCGGPPHVSLWLWDRSVLSVQHTDVELGVLAACFDRSQGRELIWGTSLAVSNSFNVAPLCAASVPRLVLGDIKRPPHDSSLRSFDEDCCILSVCVVKNDTSCQPASGETNSPLLRILSSACVAFTFFVFVHDTTPVFGLPPWLPGRRYRLRQEEGNRRFRNCM